MRRATKVTLWIVAVAVIGLGVGGTLAVRRLRPSGMKVRTVKVDRKDLVSLVTANGTLQAKTKVDLSANIMGQITQLEVQEGDRVRKGDLLLVIDPAPYAASVESRRAALESLQAELVRVREAAAQASRDLDRVQRQFHEEIIPAAEYDRARSLHEQALASVQRAERHVVQARADLAGAGDSLAKTEIRAPMDGSVTRRNVERGEVVVTGTMNNPGTVLMTISDMSTIEAVLEVDQTDVPSLKIGQPASVLIDAFPDAPFPGVVTEIGSSPIQGASALGGAATGTDYEVKVTLRSHPEGIRPGLTVTTDITTSTRTGVLTVPIGALVLRDRERENPVPDPEEGEARRVGPGTPVSVTSRTRDEEGAYVVAGGRAVFRPVQTGIKGELDVEVADGLEDGEEVVVGPFKALRELKPGAEIVVDNTESVELEK